MASDNFNESSIEDSSSHRRVSNGRLHQTVGHRVGTRKDLDPGMRKHINNDNIKDSISSPSSSIFPSKRGFDGCLIQQLGNDSLGIQLPCSDNSAAVYAFQLGL